MVATKEHQNLKCPDCGNRVKYNKCSSLNSRWDKYWMYELWCDKDGCGWYERHWPRSKSIPEESAIRDILSKQAERNKILNKAIVEAIRSIMAERKERQKSLGPLQRDVLGLVTIHSGVSVEWIAEELGRSQSQIFKVLMRLRELGYIDESNQPVARG